jgi:glycosyltransferase involved in cell wall biosynthesis
MTSSSDLSIILPAYNAESTIASTLDSTVALLGAGAELVVVDDGSTDQTDALVHSFRQSRRDSVVVVTQENLGLSAARNAGIRAAAGKWLTFLDADDLIVPAGITAAITAARASGCRIGKSRIDQFEDEMAIRHIPSTVPHPSITDTQRVRATSAWLLSGWGGMLGGVFDRELLDAMKPAFADVPFGEDLVFTYALSIREAHYAAVQDVGYMYRTGRPGQMTDRANPLRLSIAQAFRQCEELATHGSTRDKALLWLLIQRYRRSRAHHVVPDLRRRYRGVIATCAHGLRRRLGLSPLELSGGLLILATEAVRQG